MRVIKPISFIQRANANAKLIEAVRDSDLDKAENALKRGAQVNKMFNVGEERLDGIVKRIYKTPLMLAASNGDVAMMQKLCDYGADIHKEGFYRETAIGYAMKEKHVEAARFLHEKGARPSYIELIDIRVQHDISTERNERSREILDLVGIRD